MKKGLDSKAKKKSAPNKKPVAKKKSAPKSTVKEVKKEEEDEEFKARADSEHNQAMIYSSFLKIATAKQKWPTIREIAEDCGLSGKTVQRHMASNRSDFEKLKDKYSMFSEAALFSLATKAAQGKSKEWTELFFKVMHGIGDKRSLDITSGGKKLESLTQPAVDLSKLSVEQIKAILQIKKSLAK